MSSSSIISGGALLAVALHAVTEWGISVREKVFSPPPFMVVDNIVQDGEIVRPFRTLHREGIADFLVVIREVGGTEPLCWTVHGDQPGQGWWQYEFPDDPSRPDPLDAPMTLDDWVGGAPCWSALTSGKEYIEKVTWTHVDQSAPVVHERRFLKP